MTTVKSIPAKNLHLLLDDLDGMKITVSIGFSRDIARIYFKRRHMKLLMTKGVDTAKYFR